MGEHEEERLRKRGQMEMETAEHERKLQRSTHEARQKELHEDRVAQREHLVNLKTTLALTSDQLAQYLVASEQGPPSKLVQIVGSQGNHSTNSSFVIQDQA